MSGKTRSLLIQFSIWGGLAVTVLLLLFPVLPFPFVLIRGAAIMVMIALVHNVNRYVFSRTLLKQNWNTYFIQVFLFLVVLSVGRYLLEWFVFSPETQPVYFRLSPFRLLFFFASAAVVCFVSAVILYVVHLSKKEKELLQTINAQNEARLQNLQSQINPHFLFNTLNNVYSLVLTGSKKAPDMLLHLTELLRYSVYQKQREKVSVSDEARQIEFLIELFCLRSDEPYNINFHKQIANGIIEPMILIPLAENCLKHCDFDLNPKAFARMKLECDKDFLLFETENTFNPIQQKNETGGVGMQNIRERLQLIYGMHFDFNAWQEGSIYKVELRITWKK
jgi:sensor histidine kinase YesM